MPAAHSSNSASAAPSKAPGAVGWAVLIIVVASVFRLLVAAILPTGEDEAYAIGIARQFSLSYYDHPPLHFWLVGSWARLWNNESLLLLRLPFVALSALSSWLLFDLTRRLFGADAGPWAVGIFNLAPVFGLVHGTLVLPDGPLLAASLGTALVVARIVWAGDERSHLGHWALAGFLAGLALLSKYHGVLLVGGLFLFLLSGPQRRWLQRPGPWLALSIATLMFLPVVVWNAQHDWVSFAFQGARGQGDGPPDLGNLAQTLLAQSVYLLPWVLVPLAAAFGWGLVGGPRRAERWFLVCLAGPPILLFSTLSASAPILPHWPMPGWLFTIPLLATWLAKLRPFSRSAAKAIGLVSAVVLAGIVGVGMAHARWGVLGDLLRPDPTVMLQPWDSLALELERRHLPADDHTFIASANWRRASALNYLFGKTIPVLCLCGTAKHFAFLHPPQDFAGWTGILIDTLPSLESSGSQMAAFATLSPIEDVSISKAGRVTHGLYLRIGTDFRP